MEDRVEHVTADSGVLYDKRYADARDGGLIIRGNDIDNERVVGLHPGGLGEPPLNASRDHHRHHGWNGVAGDHLGDRYRDRSEGADTV